MKNKYLDTFLTVVALICTCSATRAASLSDYVNPLIGTGPSNVAGDAVPGGIGGATQPAAVVPFGMVQIGPDTDRPETSGYNYVNNGIKSFSLTHMSGPGCSNMGEVAFMPFTEKANWPAAGANNFKHENESVKAGYYSVAFENGKKVELTATERTGTARFSFEKSAIGQTVGFVINTGITGVIKTSGSLEFVNDRSFTGFVKGGGFCNSKGRYDVFFAVELDRPANQKNYSNDLAQISFINDGRPVVVKFGISFVSKANAMLNLRSEAAALSFDQIKNTAASKWDNALSTIQLGAQTPQEQKIIFYTSLYHSLLHPNIGSDVDGSYMGFDNKVHVDKNRTYYVNFSGWDIYRSQVQLLAFLFPKRGSDIAQSLIYQGLQGGALPKWSLNNIETNIMSGDPGSLILANMYAFGAKNFDHKAALQLMKKSSLDPSAASQGNVSRWGLRDYMVKGFMPEPAANNYTASIALEYASADFGIGNYAWEIGDQEFAKSMTRRSTYWRNLWESTSKMIRPRNEKGDWISAFDILSDKGFMEGNSVQYTWMIPHDLSTLIELMGGDSAAEKRLDNFLSKTNAGQKSGHLYLGNEPSFGVPWIYLWAHAPSKTQKSVREILKKEFLNTPGGLTGNDDLGALSSWYVWSSLGLFPAVPGLSGLAIGSPAFSEIKITPEGEQSVLLSADGAEKNIYVEGVFAAEKPWGRTWISLRDLKLSKMLNFKMSNSPQLWGNQKGQEPPSLLVNKPIIWPIN